MMIIHQLQQKKQNQRLKQISESAGFKKKLLQFRNLTEKKII